MKKILLSVLFGALALTACEKKEAPPTEPATQSSQATTAPASAPSTTHEHSEHDKHEHHGHDHTNHDHAGHDHSHDQGDTYQCGEKTIQLLVHDHDGEIVAHLTSDDITYDLNEDVQTKGRFTTDDGIAGADKGMALLIAGNTAKITTLDDKVLLDCTKK